MSQLRVVALCAALAAGLWLAGSSAAVWQGQSADEGPSTRPTRVRQARIVLPWSQLEDLSPEQEQQIREIRRDILDRMAELRREEHERIMAILTEEQRQRIPQIEQERRAAARERARARAMEDAQE